MKPRIVLAFSGGLASSVAIPWLAEAHGAEVIAVTADVGQDRDLEDVRGRALALGAERAHVLDARDAFARHAVAALRAQATTALHGSTIAELAYPVIADTLITIAEIEDAHLVAHASTGRTIDAAIEARSARMRLVAPAREWAASGVDPIEYARSHHLPAPRLEADAHHRRHLLYRPSANPAAAPNGGSHLSLAFATGLPTAINGVPLALGELLESLALIAGRHGIGQLAAGDAPAVVVLHAAFHALAHEPGIVHLELVKGRHTVVGIDNDASQSVTHA